MLLLYKIAFITGILYTVSSVLLGQLFDSIDVDLEFEGDFNIPYLSILPIKPITVVTFITTFGGVGIMATNRGLSSLYSFLASFGISYAVSFFVYRFIVLPIFKAQNTSAASQKEIIGVDARVTSSILENGFGRISYVKNGNTYDSPAKHVKGKSVKVGTDVFIVDIKENVFYVELKNFYYEIN